MSGLLQYFQPAAPIFIFSIRVLIILSFLRYVV